MLAHPSYPRSALTLDSPISALKAMLSPSEQLSPEEKSRLLACYTRLQHSCLEELSYEMKGKGEGRGGGGRGSPLSHRRAEWEGEGRGDVLTHAFADELEFLASLAREVRERRGREDRAVASKEGMETRCREWEREVEGMETRWAEREREFEQMQHALREEAKRDEEEIRKLRRALHSSTHWGGGAEAFSTMRAGREHEGGGLAFLQGEGGEGGEGWRMASHDEDNAALLEQAERKRLEALDSLQRLRYEMEAIAKRGGWGWGGDGGHDAAAGGMDWQRALRLMEREKDVEREASKGEGGDSPRLHPASPPPLTHPTLPLPLFCA